MGIFPGHCLTHGNNKNALVQHLPSQAQFESNKGTQVPSPQIFEFEV
jgi:hypothetical protein